MFGKHIGIDLGTVNVLVHVKGRGIVMSEPSVVAISVRDNKMVAVGHEAYDMLGRSPESIEVVRPMRDGVIADFVLTEVMLRYFIQSIVGNPNPLFRPLFRPKVMISTPRGVTSVEERAVHDAAMQAGAGAAYLIPEPLAAAYGAGLPIGTPTGNMVVDMGGGTTEAAVVTMNDIVVWSSVRVGGNRFDEAIINYVRKKYNLLIGEQTAEEIKIAIGSALPMEQDRSMEVRGRDQVTGLPKIMHITSSEVTEALQEPLQAGRQHGASDAGKDTARTGSRYYRPRHGADRWQCPTSQHCADAHPGDGCACLCCRESDRVCGAWVLAVHSKIMKSCDEACPLCPIRAA
jgi:rod shape-determining protein MreB